MTIIPVSGIAFISRDIGVKSRRRNKYRNSIRKHRKQFWIEAAFAMMNHGNTRLHVKHEREIPTSSNGTLISALIENQSTTLLNTR